jgi:hypothetical protein
MTRVQVSNTGETLFLNTGMAIRFTVARISLLGCGDLHAWRLERQKTGISTLWCSERQHCLMRISGSHAVVRNLLMIQSIHEQYPSQVRCPGFFISNVLNLNPIEKDSACEEEVFIQGSGTKRIFVEIDWVQNVPTTCHYAP